jgi:5-methylcytosine-specific restriction protein A
MFNVGQTYRRKDLHDQYGGQRQGGISTPADQPLIFLFTGGRGSLWGYEDSWEPDGTFRYSGEGQTGDMEFRAGNLAVRDHGPQWA